MPTGQLVITDKAPTDGTVIKVHYSYCSLITNRRVSHARCTAILKVDRWWSLQLVRTGQTIILSTTVFSAPSHLQRDTAEAEIISWIPSAATAENPDPVTKLIISLCWEAKLLPRHYQEFQSSLVLSLPLFRGLFTFIFFQSRPFLYVSFAGWQFSVRAGPGIKSTPWAEQSLSRLPRWV